MLAALAAVAPAPAHAAFPGVNGKIAFTRSAESSALHTIDPAGGPSSPLADGTFAAWSPDGSRIAFTRTADGVDRIHVMNADGTGANPVALGSQAAWAPDGRRLVYVTPDWDLAIVGADGTGAEPLTSTASACESDPAWSPDGTMIALGRVDNCGTGTPEQDLWVLEVASGATRNLTNTPDGASSEGCASWSPDGRRIAFCLSPGEAIRDTDVYEVDPAGGTPERLVEHAHWPAWSPDGRKLAFTRYETASGSLTGGLVVRDLATGAEQPLTGGTGQDALADWQPVPLEIEGPGGPTAERRPSFRWTAQPAVQCRLAGASSAGTWETCTSPRTLGPLEPGAYTFSVRIAPSPGGAPGEPVSRSFVVLDLPPGGVEVPGPLENLGFGPLVAGPPSPSVVEAAQAANALALAEAAAALADGAPVDAVAPEAGELELAVEQAGGSAARASAARVLARGSVRARSRGRVRVRLSLAKAGRALLRWGPAAARARAVVRFRPAGGGAQERTRRVLAVFAAANPVRSVRLAGAPRVRVGARVRGTVTLRRRLRGGRISVRLSANGLAEGSRQIASARARGGTIRWRGRVPRRLRGAFTVLGCTRPAGAGQGVLACAAAGRPLAVGAPATLSRARTAQATPEQLAALEAHLRGVYERDLAPAVASALGEPGAPPLTGAAATEAMTIAVVFLERVALTGAVVPGVGPLVAALPVIATRAVDEPFRRCVATPGLGNARTFMARVRDAVRVGASALAFGDMIADCLTFELVLRAAALQESGMVAMKPPEPPASYDLGFGVPPPVRIPVHSFGSRSSEYKALGAVTFRGLSCNLSTPSAEIRAGDPVLGGAGADTDPGAAVSFGITLTLTPTSADLSTCRGLPVELNVVERVRACLADRVVEGTTDSFRFELPAAGAAATAELQLPARECHSFPAPEGGFAKLSLTELRLAVRHVPDAPW